MFRYEMINDFTIDLKMVEQMMMGWFSGKFLMLGFRIVMDVVYDRMCLGCGELIFSFEYNGDIIFWFEFYT